MVHNRRLFLAASGAGLAGAALGSVAATADTWETVIDGTFTSYATLEAAWNYRYPWGSDHNGSARMYAGTTDHDHVVIESSGVLALRANRISWDEGTSTSDPHLPIHYHSGAIHAKQQVLVGDQFPNWEVKGEFQAPSARGTWPAFWLTGATSWPPEADILEYKGDARNWSNTFRNAGGTWSNTVVGVSSPQAWHGYRAWITRRRCGPGTRCPRSGRMWIIINLQMEGSAGSPGPHQGLTGRESWRR